MKNYTITWAPCPRTSFDPSWRTIVVMADNEANALRRAKAQIPLEARIIDVEVAK